MYACLCMSITQISDESAKSNDLHLKSLFCTQLLAWSLHDTLDFSGQLILCHFCDQAPVSNSAIF